MSGAAPGAQLVSVRVCLFVAGCTAHALVEGMIYAAKTANVDVINMSIGGLPSLNDANNTRAILYDRLIEKSKVQMFISAGNSGPGENTVGDPSVATKVMSVGAYITDATWEANYGTTAPVAGTDNMHPFSSRGPREDGGFKPNIMAPGAAISSTPLWQPGGPVAGTYALPPGYSMLNGTSMASPQSAGAAALLVSGAQQSGVQHQPEQLRQALNSSARFVDGYGAFEQGNGLIQVGAAWQVLAAKIKTVDITSAVPVDTALEQFLATPGIGVGIHDREGVTRGQDYTRTYTFTRTSGSGGSTTFNLSWVGNDGTFSSASSISLPKGAARQLTVNISPDEYGAHSAILNLDDPSNPGIEYQTLNTVVVPRTFTGPGLQPHHHRVRGPEPGAALLLRGRGRHSGPQGRLQRPERHARHRPGPFPAVPPVSASASTATPAPSATRHRSPAVRARAVDPTAAPRPARRPGSGKSPSRRGARPTPSSHRSP